MKGVIRFAVCVLFYLVLYTDAVEVAKEQVDNLIEEEITTKLTEDLLQSLEKKFQMDLQKSVETVLIKIKMLLQNGTSHIQDKLSEIQEMMEGMKTNGQEKLDACLTSRQNATSDLAEKALHQMVVCGYALIGHDPALAVQTVVNLKEMIREKIKPIHEQKGEVDELLKVCGHNHDSLKKVIKCVISKSPMIKSTMMEITGKLIDGIMSLTKLMAHGAMHEACLIEVIRQIEDEVVVLIDDVKNCVYENNSYNENLKAYMKENNATVLDIPNLRSKKNDTKEVKNLVKQMLEQKNVEVLDESFKDRLKMLEDNIASVNTNDIVKKISKEN